MIKLQSALIVTSPGKAEVVDDLAIPSADPGQVLIKVHAVGLNPSDWMALDALGRPGAGLGYDFAGQIVEVGENVGLSIGDRVAGFVHGCHASNYSLGAFRQYLITDASLLIRIPDELSFEKASTLGMGISTAAQALYQVLRIPLPSDTQHVTDQTILIYGGSTATGSIAIQLAKLSGLRVLTTCSAKHVPWLYSLGADEVIDYTSTDATDEIRQRVSDAGLSLILDCVGTEKTASFCYQCFQVPSKVSEKPAECVYASLMPVENPPSQPATIPADIPIRSHWKMVYTCFGRRFTLVKDDWNIHRTWEVSGEDRRFMEAFYRTAETILAKGRLQPMPTEVGDGGLEGILHGISLVRDGKVKGKKLVYKMA